MMALFRASDRCFRRIERFFSRIAVRRGWAVLIIFLLALGARLAVLPIEPIPAPGVHDEFSYLLMADTFAHGRLTNPTHPMWVHFETFHVNQQPTYCSKYFPGQGLFLAFGQVALGNAFWGVVLSTSLMCATFCWALQGWMPPRWALLGAVIAITRLCIFGYWADTYWGGAVAAIGGALVLGALPRIKRRMQIRDSVLMGVGLTILASTRPYEGLFYSLPVLVALAAFLIGNKSSRFALALRQIVLPLIAVMLLAFAFMGYYFWRTTGSALRTPYAQYSAKYDSTPFVPWKRITAVPSYDHLIMQQFYLDWVAAQYQTARLSPS